MYTLPQLPYRVDALEPYIDALTMEIHHDRHNRAYVNNLNKALEGHPDVQNKSLTTMLAHLDDIPQSIRMAVRNNGGGTFNHAFFWEIMSPKGGGDPRGRLADELRKKFGSFESFTNQFNDRAKSVFGSGWAWLVISKQGNLELMSTANQDCPISYGATPILGLDVWEHAYYLQYQNHRPDYIYAWWHVIDWDRAEELFRQVR